MRNASDQPKQEAFVTKNPATGEVRQVTADDWRKQSAELIAAGFVRPDGIEADKDGN